MCGGPITASVGLHSPVQDWWSRMRVLQVVVMALAYSWKCSHTRFLTSQAQKVTLTTVQKILCETMRTACLPGVWECICQCFFYQYLFISWLLVILAFWPTYLICSILMKNLYWGDLFTPWAGETATASLYRYVSLGCHKFWNTSSTVSSWLVSEALICLFLSVLILNLLKKHVFIASFERLTWCVLKLLLQSLSFSVYIFAFSVQLLLF